MASLEEIGEGLDRVLDKAAETGAVLRTAAELAEEAQDLLGAAAEGSLEADVETTTAQFAEVIRGVAELHRNLGAGVDGVQRILHGLQLAGAGPPRAALPAKQAPRGGERVDRMRRDLPPPVQPRSGQKTHGRWFTDADAPDTPARELTSGHDKWWETAEQHLLDLGLPAAPVTAADVEIKIAVHMARNGIQHATLVLNNTPCLRHDVACVKWIHQIGGPISRRCSPSFVSDEAVPAFDVRCR